MDLLQNLTYAGYTFLKNKHKRVNYAWWDPESCAKCKVWPMQNQSFVFCRQTNMYWNMEMEFLRYQKLAMTCYILYI